MHVKIRKLVAGGVGGGGFVVFFSVAFVAVVVSGVWLVGFFLLF